MSAVEGHWPSYFQETINYPSTSASILISNTESTVTGSATEVAIITFEVVTDQAVVTELEVDVQSFIHRNEFDSTSKIPFTSPRSVTQIALNSASHEERCFPTSRVVKCFKQLMIAFRLVLLSKRELLVLIAILVFGDVNGDCLFNLMMLL